MQAIGTMKSADNGSLAPEHNAQHVTAVQQANAVLDIPGVGQRALGKHWRVRTAAERLEFIALLEELFVKVAYPKTAAFFTDYKIDVLDERINGSRAMVRTAVHDPKEGQIAIDYRLIQNDGNWRVRDILLDDVSLVTNLRSQFNKIISKDSYDELLRRIREKIAE
jgi:phospholipid transport system substrate-binding protein